MKKHAYLLFVFILVAFAICNSKAQSIEPSNRGEISSQSMDFRNLTLSVIPIKQNYLPLEPIGLKFVLENKTTVNIAAHGNFSFTSNFVKIYIEKPNGDVQKIDRLSYQHSRAITRNAQLLPNARFEKIQVLSFELDRFIDRIGLYKIKADFQNLDGSQTISTGWASFFVVQPVGTNLVAYDYLKQRKNVSTFFSIYDNESLQNQKNFLDVFPDSDYSNYLRYLLVDYYLHEGQTSQAGKALEKITSDRNFVFVTEANKKLLDLKSNLKN